MNCALFSKMDQVFSFFKKNLKTGKWGEKLVKSGNFVNPKKWEPYRIIMIVRQIVIIFSIIDQILNGVESTWQLN